MNDSRISHLQMIQDVITRMASNSFLVKGWSMSIVTAVFALAIPDSRTGLVSVAFLPGIAFWGLDGYFLQQERLFRHLFCDTRKLSNENTDFSMCTKKYESNESWISAMMSSTLILFHGALLLAVVIVLVLVK